MGEMIPVDQGRLRILTPGSPVVGTDFSITQDAHVRWAIMSLFIALTTDATVAARIPELTFHLGAVEVLRLPSVSQQTASLTWLHSWVYKDTFTVPTGSTVRNQMLPKILLFNNQIVISTQTVAIQAGDQWSNPALIVQEWIEPLT